MISWIFSTYVWQVLTNLNIEYFIFSISFELKSNFRASNFILGGISPSVHNFQIISAFPGSRHPPALLPALKPMTENGFAPTGIPNLHNY